MSSSSGPVLGNGSRFTIIQDDDHTGIVWIVTLLCIIYTILIFILRVIVTRHTFGLDDWLAVAANIFAIPQYALILGATARGLGRSFDHVNTSSAIAIGRCNIASNALALISIGLTKCSVILLCRRLFSSRMKRHIILCDVAVGIAVLWFLGSIFAVAIDCSSLNVIGYSGTFCSNLVPRWQAIGAINGITEMFIVLLGASVVWPLHMGLVLKIQVLVAFILRLFLVVFVVLHIHYLRDATNHSDPGVSLASPTIYLELELLYSLTSAAIPALNRWLRGFNTSMGGTWMQRSRLYGSNRDTDGTGIQTYQLHSIDKPRLRTYSQPGFNSRGQNPRFTPNDTQYVVTVGQQHPSSSQSIESQGHHSTGSTNSEDMIIRKDIQWQIQYE